MWEINYDEPLKLWMSIGSGLVVAGFILFLTSTWNTFGSIERLSDKVHADLPSLYSLTNNQSANQSIDLAQKIVNIRELQTKSIIFLMCLTYGISLALIITGLFIFAHNYKKFKERNDKKI
jgi:hypothetical protein